MIEPNGHDVTNDTLSATVSALSEQNDVLRAACTSYKQTIQLQEAHISRLTRIMSNVRLALSEPSNG